AATKISSTVPIGCELTACSAPCLSVVEVFPFPTAASKASQPTIRYTAPQATKPIRPIATAADPVAWRSTARSAVETLTCTDTPAKRQQACQVETSYEFRKNVARPSLRCVGLRLLTWPAAELVSG